MKKFLRITLLFLLTTSVLFGQDFTIDLLYKKHTLPFEYPYEKGIRQFRQDEISKHLNIVSAFKSHASFFSETLGVLRNYANMFGMPPVTPNNTIDKFKIERDSFGNLRNQGIPLYKEPPNTPSEISAKSNEKKPPASSIPPEKYAKDGELISFTFIENGWAKVTFPLTNETWYTHPKYVLGLDTASFNHVITVDIKNQNIMTLENIESNWVIRSMTHATTGLKKPPYSFATEPGIFVLQSKTPEMNYLKEGSKTEIEGFAPFASRFSGGGYVHGIPVNLPQTEIIETTPTLGTTPRSHKCVRTRASHAQFIYDWAPARNSLFIIID